MQLVREPEKLRFLAAHKSVYRQSGDKSFRDFIIIKLQLLYFNIIIFYYYKIIIIIIIIIEILLLLQTFSIEMSSWRS